MHILKSIWHSEMDKSGSNNCFDDLFKYSAEMNIYVKVTYKNTNTCFIETPIFLNKSTASGDVLLCGLECPNVLLLFSPQV